MTTRLGVHYRRMLTVRMLEVRMGALPSATLDMYRKWRFVFLLVRAYLKKLMLLLHRGSASRGSCALADGYELQKLFTFTVAIEMCPSDLATM